MEAKIKLSALNRLSKTMLGQIVAQAVLNACCQQEPVDNQCDTWIYFDMPDEFVKKLKNEVLPSEIKLFSRR